MYPACGLALLLLVAGVQGRLWGGASSTQEQLTEVLNQLHEIKMEVSHRAHGVSLVLPASDEDLFASIDSKFDFINEYTRIKFPNYQRGQWGIAGKNSQYDYGVSKTRFIFDELRKRIMRARHRVQTVCEIGFNAGHSATLFLDALPHVKLVEFDLGDVEWSGSNAELLRNVYGSRFTYIKGDSAVTMPEWAKNGTKCDVVFVDGQKGAEGRRRDVIAMAKLSHPNTWVFGDEGNNDDCISGRVDEKHERCAEGCCWDTHKAWNKLVREGLLEYIGCSPENHLKDISCLFKYTMRMFNGQNWE